MLFLQAWGRSAAVPACSDAPMHHQVSNSWTSGAAIEAFKRWLDSYEGQTIIEITYNDIVLVAASISHNLVLRFVAHALEPHPDAAIGFELDGAASGMIKRLMGRGELSGEARAALQGWDTNLQAAVLEARRRMQPRQDPTGSRRWTGNGLSRVCGIDTMDVP